MHVTDGLLQVWYVQGIDNYLFPTKFVAWRAARRHFPDDDPDTQYNRLYYRTISTEAV